MEDSLVRVNLGCGAHIIPGWINIDYFYEPKEENKDFVKADITKDIPIESGTVDYLICDQVMEHLESSEIPNVLYNIRRVLKKGGRAVIVVPDFRGAAEQWLSVDHDTNFNPMVYEYLSEVIYGNQLHAGEYHRTPMTAGYLDYALKLVGFRKYELLIYPTAGKLPEYPGIEKNENARLRNSQLVADITNE